MDTKLDNDDVELLMNNWRRVPVVGTQVFMKKFPYLLAPWDHWNMVVDTLKQDSKKDIESNLDNKNQLINKNTLESKIDYNFLENNENNKRNQNKEENKQKNKRENEEYDVYIDDSTSIVSESLLVDWEISDDEC